MDFALQLLELLAGPAKREEVESKLERPPGHSAVRPA
jgi:hypothetical protein